MSMLRANLRQAVTSSICGLHRTRARCRLSLALSYDEMLDADSFASDLACREDARRARLQALLHRDTTINGEPCSLRPSGVTIWGPGLV